MSRGALRAVGVLLAAALAAAPATAAPASAVRAEDGAPGVGDAYWPLDGNGGIDVASYRISNRYAFDTGRLTGRTRVRLRVTHDLASFSLDFLLPVRWVRVDGVRTPFERAGGGHELRITPRTALVAGTRHSVVVSYAGTPSRRAYAGERNWLADRHEVVAMNEPHMAPWWFPANDHPSDKARMDIAVTVPRGKQVVANGRLVSRTVRARSTRWRWRADEPMAPYLAFFAAGDFRLERGTSNGTPWLVAVSERLPAAAARDSMTLMRRTPAITAGLERDLGDYPFSVVGGLTISLDVGFALENQTRPTYPAVGAWNESLVVHELAHQWFGDHVAVHRWADIWLNEGFATFMEWRWGERHGATSAADRLQSLHRGLTADNWFWALTIGDPGPDHLFDEAVYVRGAMTVQALRNRVGNAVFWQIVRRWLDVHGGGNGSSAQFEAMAEQVSGRDLGSFFDAWLRTGSKPAATADNGLA